MMLPCGNAVYCPKLTATSKVVAPSARYAAMIFARRSPCVIPSRSVATAGFDQLARARLLEARADPRQIASRGNHRDEGPFAQSPSDAGEIEHARAAFEDDGADLVLRHQPPSLLQTRAPLVGGDRHD